MHFSCAECLLMNGIMCYWYRATSRKVTELISLWATDSIITCMKLWNWLNLIDDCSGVIYQRVHFWFDALQAEIICAVADPVLCLWSQIGQGHTVHVMNSSCFNRGNSICWWHFPNATGPREGLPCCSTQGVLPDQDFSPQRGSQGRDLCQRAEERLEGRTGP